MVTRSVTIPLGPRAELCSGPHYPRPGPPRKHAEIYDRRKPRASANYRRHDGTRGDQLRRSPGRGGRIFGLWRKSADIGWWRSPAPKARRWTLTELHGQLGIATLCARVRANAVLQAFHSTISSSGRFMGEWWGASGFFQFKQRSIRILTRRLLVKIFDALAEYTRLHGLAHFSDEDITERDVRA